MKDPKMVDSTSEERVANNTVRYQYRILSEAEKATMMEIKDHGEAFVNLMNILIEQNKAHREYALAKTKMEEAVMWAVKGVSA